MPSLPVTVSNAELHISCLNREGTLHCSLTGNRRLGAQRHLILLRLHPCGAGVPPSNSCSTYHIRMRHGGGQHGLLANVDALATAAGGAWCTLVVLNDFHSNSHSLPTPCTGGSSRQRGKQMRTVS